MRGTALGEKDLLEPSLVEQEVQQCSTLGPVHASPAKAGWPEPQMFVCGMG